MNALETPPGADRPGISKRLAASTALLAFALAAWVAPSTFIDPHLYGEEASVYFAFAWRHSFAEAVATPHLGYYALVPNLATALAARLPLALAPFATLAAGVLVVASLGAVLLARWGPIGSPRLRALAFLALVAVPPGYLRLHTTFAQFWLAIAAAALLVSDHDAARGRGLRAVVLVTAGLTGVVATFLTPLFWLVAWRRRSRASARLALLLTACAVLQLLAHGFSDPGPAALGASRFDGFGPLVPIAAAVNQTLVHAFAGGAAFDALGAALRTALENGDARPGTAALSGAALAALLGAGLVVLVALFVGPRHRARTDPDEVARRASGSRARQRGLLLLCAYALVVLLSIAAGTTGAGGAARTAFIDGHARYFYAPNGFLVLAVFVHLDAAIAARSATLARPIYALIALWLLAIGLWIAAAGVPPQFRSGPSWRAQVDARAGDPNHPLLVWPANRWPPLFLPSR